VSKKKTGVPYRAIPITFFDREDIRGLSANAAALWLYFYLMAGPHSTRIPGVFRAGKAALAEGLRWSIETFQESFDELAARGMARADWNAPLVWLPGEMNPDNQPDNQDHTTGIMRAFALLPDCDLKEEARSAWGTFLTHCGHRVDTVSAPVAVTETETGAGGARPLLSPGKEEQSTSKQPHRCPECGASSTGGFLHRKNCSRYVGNDQQSSEECYQCGRRGHRKNHCPKNPDTEEYKQAQASKPHFVGLS